MTSVISIRDTLFKGFLQTVLLICRFGTKRPSDTIVFELRKDLLQYVDLEGYMVFVRTSALTFNRHLDNTFAATNYE